MPFEKISYVFLNNLAATWVNFQPQPWKKKYFFKKTFSPYYGMTADEAIKIKKTLIP